VTSPPTDEAPSALWNCRDPELLIELAAIADKTCGLPLRIRTSSADVGTEPLLQSAAVAQLSALPFQVLKTATAPSPSSHQVPAAIPNCPQISCITCTGYHTQGSWRGCRTP
jgi:hypothetical protein